MGIEHTRIEPYEGFIADWNLAHARLGPVRELLESKLPADSVFDLSFEPASATRISSRDSGRIADWIEAVAPALGRPPDHFAQCPDEICRGRLTLYRWPITGGVITTPQIRYRIGIDTAAAPTHLSTRCRRAMDAKLGKLDDARRKHHVETTLLCLESSDLQLTDPFGLADVLRAAAEGHPVPDFVVLVMVGPDGEPFMSWTYRQPGRWLPRPLFYSHDAT
ncbi:MAG: hypothetical protein JO248_11695 [Acidimicrobiia bacterium]|nr:hypothetical protein [Acidimicrobiia bacterium]